MSTAIGRRSNGGCWTCRLRKKKCDETHPMCNTCTSLDIPCYSYGQKPQWMDGGAQERAVAQEVKRLVNLSVRRRLRRSSAAQGARQRTSACQPDETGPKWNQYEDGAVRTHLGFPSPRSPSPNTQCSGDRKHETPVCQRSPNPTSTHLSPPAPGASQTQEPVRADDVHVKFAPTLQSIATPDSSSVPSPEDECQASFPPCDITEIEMALLAYYLDFVFYEQFPFYKPHTAISGRGWLLSLLMNRGTSYYACLSLSANYQHALSPQDVETESSRNALSQWYLALAIQDMQQNIDLVVKRASTEIDHSCINLLFGMLQLTFLSLSGNFSAGWQMHLQASSTLIPTTLLTVTKKLRLVKDLPVNATDSCNKGSTDNPCGVDDRPVVDGPAIRFLLSAFVWLDSIASASTCSRPILPLDHQRLLEENEVDMVSVTGCRNWAMAAVVKVCKLDNWKKTLEGENRLSTRKLVDEATAIEQSIRDQAAQMLGNDVFYVSRHPSLSSSQASADYIEKLITTIFALSSLTYLHVVVSGGCPELPEIKESVSKTIEALRQIPEPHLLNRVIWPFCVAGCLAVESQYDFFTDMGDGILSRRHIKAISIIQSCWELRQTQAAPCKWSDVPFSPALLV